MPLFKALLMSCMCALTIANMAVAQSSGEKQASFKDWQVTCQPAATHCAAATYINQNSSATGEADYVLRIGREKSSDDWDISLSTIVTMPTETSFIVIDDEPNTLYFDRPGSFAAFGAENDFYFLGNEARRLLEKMLSNNEMTLNFDTLAGDQTLNISLRGLTASMLWIDEQQDRVGSPRDAGFAPSTKQLVSVLDQPPAEIPQPILDLHFFTDTCDFDATSDMFSTWESMALDQEHILYLLPCSAGAYNLLSRAYVWNKVQKSATPQYFVDFSNTTGWTAVDYLVNAYLDPHSLTLSSFSKSRGLGDCGSAGIWQWTRYGIELRKYFYQPVCMLNFDENADLAFPQIYPKSQ